jgi:hypothetical protein
LPIAQASPVPRTAPWRGGVETATKGLAVDRHDLPGGDFVQGRDPTQQAGLELDRLDRAQHGVEAVV